MYTPPPRHEARNLLYLKKIKHLVPFPQTTKRADDSSNQSGGGGGGPGPRLRAAPPAGVNNGRRGRGSPPPATPPPHRDRDRAGPHRGGGGGGGALAPSAVSRFIALVTKADWRGFSSHRANRSRRHSSLNVPPGEPAIT